MHQALENVQEASNSPKGKLVKTKFKTESRTDLSHADKCIINCSVTMRMKFTQNLQRYKAAVWKPTLTSLCLYCCSEHRLSQSVHGHPILSTKIQDQSNRLTSPTTRAHFLNGFLDESPSSCIANLQPKCRHAHSQFSIQVQNPSKLSTMLHYDWPVRALQQALKNPEMK